MAEKGSNMHPRKKILVKALTVVCLGTQAVCANAQQGIIDLGALPAATWSEARAVSADGSTVVGTSDSAMGQETTFRWTTASGMQDLGSLAGANGRSYPALIGTNGSVEVYRPVSADGSVVVGHSQTSGSGNWRAYHWSIAHGLLDLGHLGSGSSYAAAVSADGSVVAGSSEVGGRAHAARWTVAPNGTVAIQDLGVLGTGNESWANDVSADGGAVVGYSATSGWSGGRAFRWTQAGGMEDLGTLPGGNFSYAYSVSADGSTVVGRAHDGVSNRAFRWTAATGMQNLDMGNTFGTAEAILVSAYGDVVVGQYGGSYNQAFRWTASSGMQDLGNLGGGSWAYAYAMSADGSVVVGRSHDPAGSRGFRWNETDGMQSVEDWLRAAGVTVPMDITYDATSVSADGKVVVGTLHSGFAYIARAGSGLITLEDLRDSLAAMAAGGGMALSSADLVLSGAHSRPLARLAPTGRRVFWLAGDWGQDDHGSRDGDLGLAEIGLGRNFGSVQLNAALGRTWARQNLPHSGHAEVDGNYLLAEALIPLSGKLWAVLGGYVHWGEAELRRGYLSPAQDFSSGRPDAGTWSLRARLEWDGLWQAADASLSPYADLSYSRMRMDAYTESGGGFPASYAARKDKATELRLGVQAGRPLSGSARLLATLETAHRFEDRGAGVRGQVIGLSAFDFAGTDLKQNWLRAGVGFEGVLADGTVSAVLNATTRGEVPAYWLALSWQKTF